MDKLKSLLILFLIVSIIVNIYQHEQIKLKNTDIELELGSKVWWYGAATGCMESSGYWNTPKKVIVDNNLSWVFWDGYNTSNATIQNYKNKSVYGSQQ